MDSRTLAFVLAINWPAADAFAWDATRHEWVSGIAIEKLPDDVPAFVRASDAVVEMPCARLREGVGLAHKGAAARVAAAPLLRAEVAPSSLG